MLQYLLNATAIWLTCLISFDIFLRKESYHSYNRLYLLLTFILGLLLPLWQWRHDSVAYSISFSRPVIEQAASIKGNILPATTISNTYSWQEWLWAVYLAGVCISLLLLLKESFEINKLYRRGDKSKDGVWTIVETGQSHSPFSAFRMVFISSKKDYNEEQLKMILHHEEQHGHAMHFVDLLLMQLAKVALWFHPLVYVYYNRLMIIHEYQADAAVDKDPKLYGQFLIEQTMLSTAPALSHSFNRSPIKKRILMLTRNSSAFSKSKMLLALPVIVLCVLCFSKNAFSDDKRIKNGNKITFHGNTIEMKEWPKDTLIMLNPTTGKEETIVSSREPRPISLNGNKIYDADAFANTQNTMGSKFTGKSGLNYEAVREYLLSNMKDEVKKLADGQYFMSVSNIVVNESGDIVYYDFLGIRNKEDTVLSDELQKAFAKKINILLLDAPAHESAYLDGKPVPSIINDVQAWNPFSVKDGKVIRL